MDQIPPKFLTLLERAMLASHARPGALESVENEILKMADELTRELGQRALLRAQDIVALEPITGHRAWAWIVGARLSFEQPLPGRDCSSLWLALREELDGLHNPLTQEALRRRGREPTRPGVVLHSMARCNAAERLWVGFNAAINPGDCGQREHDFSVTGSTNAGELAICIPVPAFAAPAPQDGGTVPMSDAFVAEVVRRITSAVSKWSAQHPVYGLTLSPDWMRLSTLVEHAEMSYAKASLRKGFVETLNLKSPDLLKDGVDVVVGATPTLEPFAGHAAFVGLFQPEDGRVCGFASVPLLAGTPLTPLAEIAVDILRSLGVPIVRTVIAPRAPIIRRLEPFNFVQPCPDGRYRSPELVSAGNAAWRLKSLGWERGWLYGGPAFDNDDAVRHLSALPHPVALLLAGGMEALAEHYEPDLLAEFKEQMATPGRLETVAAGQLRLKDERLYGLAELDRTHGEEFEEYDPLLPPSGLYAAAHWKLAQAPLMIAKAGLLVRMRETEIEKGFPLHYLRLPFPDLYMHFAVPLARKRRDGRVFQVTGFYASEEGAQAVGHLDKQVERLATLTFTYRYQGEAVRTGALTVPFSIRQNDERELSEVVVEYNKTVRGAVAGEVGHDDDIEDAVFANEAALLAAKLLLYLTLKAARTESVNERSDLIERARAAKGGQREKLQAKVKRAFDYILVGEDDDGGMPPIAIGDERTMRPHWRKGYIRDQPFGEGRRERRPVWIKPVLVNAAHVTGGDPPKKTYILE